MKQSSQRLTVIESWVRDTPQHSKFPSKYFFCSTLEILKKLYFHFMIYAFCRKNLIRGITGKKLSIILVPRDQHINMSVNIPSIFFYAHVVLKLKSWASFYSLLFSKTYQVFYFLSLYVFKNTVLRGCWLLLHSVAVSCSV